MAKLMCEICGGSLIMNAGNIAECENCGMKYAKEKVVQMVKIDGAVEITKGEAEKVRLLNNVETYLKLGKYAQAYELCQNITDEYPDDFRGWYFTFKSCVYIFANNIRIPHTDCLKEADSNLITALKLTNDKDVLGREAVVFWFDILKKGNPDLNALYAFRNSKNCTDNHIISMFIKRIDEQILFFLNQLNSCQNKKDVCDKLGFTSRFDEPIKNINSFSFENGWLTADGTIVRKKFDGISFWGSKTKYQYEELAVKDIYHLKINFYNELQELIKALSNLTNQ